MRTYCKIIGTRERDYSGNALGQGISQEMTVFSGGAGVPYTEDVIRAARDVFQMYGGKTSYGAGVFSSVMRSVAGQAFVCCGISQKQALGRDAQFTQLLITPREELLDGEAFRQQVLNLALIGEEAVHRVTRPEPEEVFRTNAYPRCEVRGLDQKRRSVLMRVASLLCTGRRVLLVERDEAHRRDFFRPVLRELFELIPAGHRYQIDVTTGRCEEDMERLGSTQLIVTDQPFGSTLERQQLRLDLEETVRLTSGEARWAGLTNAERDEFSRFVGGSDITLQTEFSRLMDCMDDEKSFWWLSGEHNGEFKTLDALFRRHDSTPILGMPRINLQFCRRIPELLGMPGTFEDYYFELQRNEDIPYETRVWCLKYLIKGKLRKFGLSDEEFARIEGNYMNFEKLLNDMHEINARFDSFAGRQGEALSALQATVGQQGQTFERQLDALQKQAAETGMRIESLASSQKEALDRQSAEQEEKIGALRQSQDTRLQEVQRASEAAAQAISATTQRLTVQDTRLQEVQRASEAAAQAISATTQRLTVQDTRLEEVRRASEAATASAAAQTAAGLSKLDGRLDELNAVFSKAGPQKQVARIQNELDDLKRSIPATVQEALRRAGQPNGRGPAGPEIRELAQKIEHIGGDVEQMASRVDKTNAGVATLREHIRSLSGGTVPGPGGGKLLQWLSIGLSALALIGFVIGGVLFAGWQRTNSE